MRPRVGNCFAAARVIGIAGDGAAGERDPLVWALQAWTPELHALVMLAGSAIAAWLGHVT